MTTSDEEAEPPEFSLTRDRVGRVLAMLEAKRANGGLDPAEIKAHEVATLRLYGAGASPKKFARLAEQQVDGVLRGQYRFAGAGQTGRLPRGARKSRIWLVMSSARTAPPRPRWSTRSRTAAVTPRWPRRNRSMCRWRANSLCSCVLLSLPGLGKYSSGRDSTAIEARTTPWLAASEGAEKVLDVFRVNDADPTRPDIYTLAAADILHKDPQAITKIERGIGKVACLSLAFGGSVGALQRMALSYRIHLDDAEARRIVTAWRDANLWAREFWGAHRDEESFGLWGAAMRAWETPGEITAAGRLAFVYREDYLGGCLFMGLPSGRLLSYPRPRWRDVNILDKDGKPTGEKRHELSFQRAHGRTKLWHGTLAENATQATAADILRQTVTRIETNPDLAFMPIRMTTHDEIVCEVDEARAEEAKVTLRREMLTVPDWAVGLPLQSEESVCFYYTKSKAALQ